MSDAMHIPLFIRARSEDELVRKMLRNNIANGKAYKYFDIQHVGKFWLAWYVGDASSRMRNVFERPGGNK